MLKTNPICRSIQTAQQTIPHPFIHLLVHPRQFPSTNPSRIQRRIRLRTTPAQDNFIMTRRLPEIEMMQVEVRGTAKTSTLAAANVIVIVHTLPSFATEQVRKKNLGMNASRDDDDPALNRRTIPYPGIEIVDAIFRDKSLHVPKHFWFFERRTHFFHDTVEI